MRIAVDVDGVLSALHEEWYRRYNRDYDDDLTNERVLSWDTHEYVKPECGKRIYDYLYDADLYEHIEPVAGSLEGVNALRNDGHRVFFVTANVRGMTDQKWDWLVRHGFMDSKNRAPIDMVVAFDKLLIDADLIIDDKAQTCVDWVEQKRRKAILFEYPHNRHLLDEKPSAFWMWCLRADNWPGVVKHVRMLSAPALHLLNVPKERPVDA